MDVHGRGVADVDVRFEPATRGGFGEGSSTSSARSGPDGEFRLPWPGRSGRLVGVSEGLVTLLSPSWFGPAPEPPVVIVVAEPCDLDGAVHDELRQPLEGAHVSVLLTPEQKDELPVEVPALARVLGEARSGGDGSFSIRAVPCLEDATLLVQCDGFASASLRISETGWSGLDVRLSRNPGRIEVRGLVLDRSGAPVEGALVAAGEMSDTSDELGRFAVSCPSSLARAEIRAAAPGRGADVVWIDLRSAQPVNEVTLVLSDRGLGLSGRVVDANGAPLDGCLVRVLEGTPLGRMRDRIGDLAFQRPVTVEEVLAGQDAARGSQAWVQTDASGAFSVGPLVDREYTLVAVQPESLRHVELGPVAAGASDLLLVLADRPRSLVAGVVRTVDGVGLPECTVVPTLDFRSSLSGSGPIRLPEECLRATPTDASGRFDLGALETDALVLSIMGPRVRGEARLDVAAAPDPARLDVVVHVAASFRVTFPVGPSPDCDSLRVLAEDGSPLTVATELMGASIVGQVAPCPAGRAGVFETDTRARRLVLLKRGQPVRQLPLDLVPGVITTIGIE